LPPPARTMAGSEPHLFDRTIRSLRSGEDIEAVVVVLCKEFFMLFIVSKMRLVVKGEGLFDPAAGRGRHFTFGYLREGELY